MGEDRKLTVEEVAVLVRARPETLRRWRRMGRGPRHQRPEGTRRILYAESDVRAWLESGATRG